MGWDIRWGMVDTWWAGRMRWYLHIAPQVDVSCYYANRPLGRAHRLLHMVVLG